MKYTPKAAIVEAIQFTENPDCVAPLLALAEGNSPFFGTNKDGYYFEFKSPEGDAVRKAPGAWIVKGEHVILQAFPQKVFERNFQQIESRQPEIEKLKEVLEQCAEALNLFASRAGIQTEDAALKSDAEDFGALAALRAARGVLTIKSNDHA